MIKDRYTKEIIKLSMLHIKDKQFKDSLIKAVFKNKGNLARIMSEELSESFPNNTNYKRIDNLITDKFFG